MESATTTLEELSAGVSACGGHVVHGVLSLEVGGLERLVLNLVRIGRERGQRVSVICVEKEGQLSTQVRGLGADVWCLGKKPGKSEAAVAAAADLLRTIQADVIHTHQIGAAYYLGQASERLKLPRPVHTEHSDHVAHAKGLKAKLRARLLWRQNSRLISRFCCVSEDVAKSVKRWGTVPTSKVAVVLNGIETNVLTDRSVRHASRELMGISPTALVVGTVGRLAEVKRQDLLVRVLPRLRGEFGDVRLLIVGDGPEKSRLESLAASVGAADGVIFVGYQSEPQRFLAAMDVFALTSRHEGLPLSLLEAWASKLPVVCSAVGGMAAAVEHEQDGLLFPSGDVDKLGGELSRVLSSPATRGRLGKAGRSKVCLKYSLERMADEYAQQYALALKG